MKKIYSLALGGGAAIGFSHIGVIRSIEEKKIKINEVSGTSMGAIIAGFFAMGKKSHEMEKFAKSMNYFKLLDFDLKNGLLKGNKIYKKLYEVFGDAKIENLNIKLSIVATNVETGKLKIFKTGKIIDAVRASISLPGIFIPHKIGDSIYVDGGILNNLPIDVLNGKTIIAVSAIKEVVGPLKRKRKILGFETNLGFFNMNFQILQRSILLMMKQNEYASISTFGKEVTLIKPNTEGVDFYSFNKIDELLERGYNEANNIL
ncbi:MAG: patatin-like phospholipase family protein [Candidatus Gracilibacteria bacterium]